MLLQLLSVYIILFVALSGNIPNKVMKTEAEQRNVLKAQRDYDENLMSFIIDDITSLYHPENTGFQFYRVKSFLEIQSLQVIDFNTCSAK